MSCSDSSSGPSSDTGGGGRDFGVFDVGQRQDTGGSVLDTGGGKLDTGGGGGDGGGNCNFKDGQSCAGGQACPTGQQPVRDAKGMCFCRVPCNPQGQNQCGGAACDRVCVQLIDSNGSPIPGQGACVPDPGKGPGEACAPDACKQGLRCVGPGNDKAFCRPTCSTPQDCKGYKMVCGQLTGSTTKVCVPGENPGGPDVGGDCSDPNTFCKNGLICDPANNKCVTSCNTDGTPPPSTCGSGTSCQKVEDTTAKVLIGYGCKPGGGTGDGGTASDAGAGGG